MYIPVFLLLELCHTSSNSAQVQVCCIAETTYENPIFHLRVISTGNISIYIANAFMNRMILMNGSVTMILMMKIIITTIIIIIIIIITIIIMIGRWSNLFSKSPGRRDVIHAPLREIRLSMTCKLSWLYNFVLNVYFTA